MGERNSDALMQQAQHVWTMLDDMAENDPKAYKAFIDKQMAEKKEFASPPEPHMCVQTHIQQPKSVPFYINFCTWKRITPPANQTEPVKVAGSGIGQIEDDHGKAAATAVAFSPKVLEEYGRDTVNKSDQDTLIQIAMDFIEKQHNHIKLNRKYKILDRMYKGNLKVIQGSLFQAFGAKEKTDDEDMTNILKTFGALATDNPEHLLSELRRETENPGVSNTHFGDKIGLSLNGTPKRRGIIEEISETTTALPQPQYQFVDQTVLKVFLPGVLSVSECELEISKDDVYLLVEDKFELKLTLPKPILDNSASAKFIKKTSTLQLTLPLE